MHRGFVYLWRCIADNVFWQDKPFDRARAWVDIIMLANHIDTAMWKRGIKIEVKRGQVGWSERQLADRWGWSRTKVRAFLSQLTSENQIEPQKEPQNNNVTSLITIVNYDLYQNKEPQKEPQKSHRKATEDTRENNVNNKSIKHIARIPSGDHQKFIAWWCMSFKKITGNKAIIDTKNASLIKTMLGQVDSVGRLVSYACMVLTDDDPFYDKAGRTIGVLKAKLEGLKSSKPNGSLKHHWQDLGIAPPENIKFVDWRFWENETDQTESYTES